MADYSATLRCAVLCSAVPRYSHEGHGLLWKTALVKPKGITDWSKTEGKTQVCPKVVEVARNLITEIESSRSETLSQPAERRRGGKGQEVQVPAVAFLHLCWHFLFSIFCSLACLSLINLRNCSIITNMDKNRWKKRRGLIRQTESLHHH